MPTVTTPDGANHVFPDGATADQMIAALKDYRPRSAAPAEATGTGSPSPGANLSLTRYFAPAMPSIGGMGGGVGGAAIGTAMGGPPGGLLGALIGAGVGGAGGKVAQEASTGQPMDPGAIASEAGLQAAYEGVGRLAGPPLKALGNLAMKSALRPGVLADRFPGLVNAAIREGATVGTVLGTGGRAPLAAARGEAANAVRGLLGSAQKAGQQYSAEDLAQHALQTVQGEAGRPLTQAERDATVEAIRQRANELLSRRSFGILQHDLSTFTPIQVKAIKQTAQRVMRPSYNAAAGGIVPNPELDGALASGTQAALEGIPGIRAGESRVRDLIGVGQAVKQAERRAPGRAIDLLTGSAAGGTYAATHNPLEALVAYALARAAESPEAQSRFALLAARPMASYLPPPLAGLLGQGPRALGTLYGAAQPPTSTPGDTSIATK